jgi:protein-disulfide isomerase
MTVWFDFQCPYCKLLWQETIPPLNDAYVRKGKLKLVFSDFSFLGKDSVTAAVVGRAVWHAFPQTYFAWTNAMFDAQDGENGGFGDVASVTTLTMALPGIDGDKLAKDFNANVGTYIAEVRGDFDAARRAGVRGTPAVMIGGKMIAPTLAEITARIDAVLAG